MTARFPDVMLYDSVVRHLFLYRRYATGQVEMGS